MGERHNDLKGRETVFLRATTDAVRGGSWCTSVGYFEELSPVAHKRRAFGQVCLRERNHDGDHDNGGAGIERLTWPAEPAAGGR